MHRFLPLLLRFLSAGPRTRRGIFLFFVVGILTPSGFLAWLGLRSFQLERAVSRQEAQIQHRSAARQLAQRVTGLLAEPLDALRQMASHDAFQRWDRPAMIEGLCVRPELAGCRVRSFYLMDTQWTLIFPPVRTPAAPLQEREVDWGLLADEVERLERLEFSTKQPAQALAGYQALRSRARNPEQHAALLAAIAGAARRAGDLRSAEAASVELIRDHDGRLDPAGVPYGLTARRWLLRQYLSEGRSANAAARQSELVEGVVLQRWGAVAQADEVLAEARRTPLDASRRLRRVLAMHDGFIRRETEARAFRSELWPQATERLRAQGLLDDGGLLRLTDPTAERWLVVTPVWSPAGQRQGWLAGVIDPAPLRARLTTLLSEFPLPPGVTASLEESASTARAPAEPALKRRLAGIDPPWFLHLGGMAATASDQGVQRRFRLYGSMIALSFLVIGIGLVLMAQAMHRERELAGLKADFVAGVSHDLRTPLMAITYISDRLRHGRVRDPQDAKVLYDMLGEESARLQEMIDQVLQFSRRLNGRAVYTFGASSLNDLMNEAVEQLRRKAEAQGITLELQPSPEDVQVRADRQAARQAVANLIDNAMKHSGPARRVRIGAALANGTGLIRVTDEGDGIPDDEQPRIFEKFYRGRWSGPGGVGLGLAMVKQIAEAHGGRVSVDSAPGHGSTFTLELPLWEAA